MSGIMMLADAGWLAYQENNSAGKLAIFYASPSKKGPDGRIGERLFCVAGGTLPRNIVAAGRITAQKVLHQDKAWKCYGAQLGAATEEEWKRQASRVLENSRKSAKYNGEILLLELSEFSTFAPPVSPSDVGLDDTGWQNRKDAGDKATGLLLQRLKQQSAPIVGEPEEYPQIDGAGAGFGDSDENSAIRITKPRTEMEKEAEAEDASFHAQEQNAGFQSNPAIRLEVEKWAMDYAKNELCTLGFSKFKDTSKQQCYDYTCERDGSLFYVEVKGTQGDGTSVILTENEVRHCKAYQMRSIAVIVRNVMVDSGGRASGGISRVCLPWVLESAALKPIQYKWTVDADKSK